MDLPSQEDLDAVLNGMPTAADLGKWATIAQSASATIERLDAALAAELATIKANSDFTAEAKQRHLAAAREKYAPELTKARDTLAKVQQQAADVEPLLERADIAHLERIVWMDPKEMEPLRAWAAGLPDHLLYLASKVATTANRKNHISLLYIEAQKRGADNHYVGLARKELSGLPEETAKAIASLRQITATASLPLAKARAALNGNSPVSSLDKIASGLASMRAGNAA